MNEYTQFIERKAHSQNQYGFDPVWMPDFLIDFQEMLTRWAIVKGRGAIYADCGLGKTPMSLVWAENIVRQTNKPVLILTPLAVVQQFTREAAKFEIECSRINGGSPPKAGIFVTNYEKLHLFNADEWIGVDLDEGSAIKNFTGSRRAAVTAFLRKIPYRLLCTATAAPNDYTELGTASEALGELGLTDMLGRFFTNSEGKGSKISRGRQFGKVNKWRFKGHAEKPFWQWICSWARACRKPSDLGFDDAAFVLPPLIENDHVVKPRTKQPGRLFDIAARNMREEREERRRTIPERCEKAAELAASHSGHIAVWCHLNNEGDLLQRLIPDSRQIKGSQSDDEREEIYEAFSSGQLKRIVIKDKIGAFGLNWQHCARIIRFATHSYESDYQAVRRCWRFGQRNAVTVDRIMTEGEEGIRDNLRRKSRQADRMFTELVSFMNDAMRIDHRYEAKEMELIPSWL